MKRLWMVILAVLMLCGCSGSESKMENVLFLRSNMSSNGCTFRAKVTADYGDEIYHFTLDCLFEPSGKLKFTVIEPESISGIEGSISSGGGELTFDDALLAFAPMADGQISPVAAPWVIMKALLSGYITSCGIEDSYIRASIRDSYADDAIMTDIWITKENIPVWGEILWKNRRILTVEVVNFTLG